MRSRMLYILCGGDSRRMGQDKALLEINGRSLLEFWMVRTAPLFDEVVLLSGSTRYSVSNRQLQDEMKDTGPLAGVLAAMKDKKGTDDDFAIVAVDLPNLGNSTLQRLSADTLSHHLAMVAAHGKELQPLAGIYQRSLSADLETYLEGGRRSVAGFIDGINPGRIGVEKEELMNINKRDEWALFLEGLKST